MFQICAEVRLGKMPRLRAKPLDRALLGAVLCFGLWTMLGAVRNGDIYQAGFQTFEFLSAVLLAFVLMAVMKTPRDYAMLLGAVLAASVYRAGIAIIAYVFIVRNFPILSGGGPAVPERQAA